MASLADAQKAIVKALAQHTAYSHRASTRVANEINAMVDKAAQELSRGVAELLDELTSAERKAFAAGKYTTPALKRLKSIIDEAGKDISENAAKIWLESAREMAGYESGYMYELMQRAVDGLPTATISAAAIVSEARNRPMAGGQLVNELLSGLGVDAKLAIYSRIRSGIASGETNTQIVRGLRGTKSLRYQDGLFNKTRRDVERVVRTTRNHVANVAYEQTYQELGVKYVVVVATLDGRTSKYCASMDGTRYKMSEDYPKPPYHPNCRTVIVPSFDDELVGNRPFVRSLKVRGGYRINEDGEREKLPPHFRPVGRMTKRQREKAGLKIGQVEAKTTFASWFKNQDAAFQKEWLGPTRYKLYKEGEYTLDRFVDPTGREYTISELKQKDAKTFDAIF